MLAATVAILTWSVGEVPEALDRQQVIEATARAWSAWTWYLPVEPQYVPDPAAAEITVRFLEWDHGDGWPFDGPGGQLGHTFDLEQPALWRGQLHLDASEDWLGELSLVSVLIHELGHMLGLVHVSTEDSVMYPYYREWTFIFPLDVEDSQRIWGDLDRHRHVSDPAPAINASIACSISLWAGLPSISTSIT